MSLHPLRTASMLCTLALLPGCAAMKSVSHAGQAAPGLGYYLPKGDIKVSMTVTENDDKSLNRAFKIETLHYADLSRRYSVTLPKNPVGDSELSVNVTPAGLLTSATYKYQPRIIEAIANISPKNAATANVPKPSPCSAPGTYVQIIDLDKIDTAAGKVIRSALCDYPIMVSRLGKSPGQSYGYEGNRTNGSRNPTNGLYFRMNHPYRVDLFENAKDEHPFISEIALSPSGADILFVKVNRSLFSKTEGTISFENGVLTSFSPKNTSEIESGFKLPATIIKAYFDSVSALFTFRSGRLKDEAAYMAAIEDYNHAKASLEACEAAYASGDQAKIEANCKKATTK